MSDADELLDLPDKQLKRLLRREKLRKLLDQRRIREQHRDDDRFDEYLTRRLGYPAPRQRRWR